MATAVAAREEMILSSKSDRTNRALNGVGVQLDTTIMQQARQAFPARERISHRFGEGAAAGYKRKLRFEPESHGIDNRLRSIAACGEPVRGRLTANIRLNGIDLGDPAQGLRCNRRSSCLEYFVIFELRVDLTCVNNHFLLLSKLIIAVLSSEA